MKIIERFNEYSGRVETGGGYADISRVDRDKLIKLLNLMPAGDIIITTAPHDAGRGVLAKPATEKNPVWFILSPTVPAEKGKSGEIVLNLGSLSSKGRRAKA